MYCHAHLCILMASRINYLWVSQIDDLGLLGAILTTHLPCVGPVSTILVYGHAQLCVMVLSCINCPWVSQMNDLCNPNRPLALCVGCKYPALSYIYILQLAHGLNSQARVMLNQGQLIHTTLMNSS